MELEDSLQILQKFTTESTLSHLIPVNNFARISLEYFPPSKFCDKYMYAFLVYACYMTGTFNFIRLYHLNDTIPKIQIIQHLKSL
jgi:hypothetical protein